MSSIRSSNKSKTQTFARLSLTIMLCGLSFGCAKTGEESSLTSAPNSTQSETATRMTTSPKAQSASTLTGVWLGEATMDEGLLQAKLDSLAPEYQQSTMAKARSFLTTVMAIDFQTDGTVESEVEIVSLEGQTMRETSKGAWKVLEESETSVLVETQENLADGSITTNQAPYIKLNSDQISLVVPVCEELENCGARLVFSRHSLPANDMAQGQFETTKR